LQVHIYDLIFIKINFSLASTVLENHLWFNYYLFSTFLMKIKLKTTKISTAQRFVKAKIDKWDCI
jgi:hypothetical protein